MWIGHCKEIRKLTFRAFLTFRALAPRSEEGLTLETSASESLYGGQFTLSTQLIKPNYLVILPPTQHHSFFRNLPPLCVCTFLTLHWQLHWKFAPLYLLAARPAVIQNQTNLKETSYLSREPAANAGELNPDPDHNPNPILKLYPNYNPFHGYKSNSKRPCILRRPPYLNIWNSIFQQLVCRKPSWWKYCCKF